MLTFDFSVGVEPVGRSCAVDDWVSLCGVASFGESPLVAGAVQGLERFSPGRKKGQDK